MTEKERTALVLGEYRLSSVICEAMAKLTREGVTLNYVTQVLFEITEIELARYIEDSDATS